MLLPKSPLLLVFCEVSQQDKTNLLDEIAVNLVQTIMKQLSMDWREKFAGNLHISQGKSMVSASDFPVNPLKLLRNGRNGHFAPEVAAPCRRVA